MLVGLVRWVPGMTQALSRLATRPPLPWGFEQASLQDPAGMLLLMFLGALLLMRRK
jgi:hypothetical protein